MGRTKSNVIIISFLIASLLVVLMGCDTKTNKRNTTDESVTGTPVFVPPTTGSNPSATPTPTSNGNGQCFGTGNELGVADAGQTFDYYKLNNPPVVIHGRRDGLPGFSSDTDLPAAYNQNIFKTNSRINVRVIPRRQFHGTDSKGVPCHYYPQPYTALQVGVVVRRSVDPIGVGEYHLFDNAGVDCASKVHEFAGPFNTADPLIIDVKNVRWDYSCTDYANQGYPNIPGVCPWDNVWSSECVQIEVQFSTDATKDIPGTRTYQ
jgi:hypothetical protein